MKLDEEIRKELVAKAANKITASAMISVLAVATYGDDNDALLKEIRSVSKKAAEDVVDLVSSAHSVDF